MRLSKTVILLTAALLFTGWLLAPASSPPAAVAQFRTATPTAPPLPPGPPPRSATIYVAYTSYSWWLNRYSNNQVVCAFAIEHDGLPTPDDILTHCDEQIYDEWITTVPCNPAVVESMSACPGFYLHKLGSRPGERPIEVALPLPSAWVSIENCNPLPNDTRCTTLPFLMIRGEEPLPNELIISIQGRLNGEPFTCMGSTCSIPLKPTGMEGTVVEFWADSSFGDSTDHYQARVRLIPWGDFMNPEKNSQDAARWYVDVLSTQWRGGALATCQATWDVFPPLHGMPEWLTSPDTTQELATDISYYYLAGSLITYDVVDASACLDGGLQAPNIASPCGVEAARPLLLEWQNRFDPQILQVSSEVGVPARLLKNVFARESQIWPGLYTTYQEAGLGQLTSNGADTVLLWNESFFRQFCPLVLNQKYCTGSFWQLPAFEQSMLRGALVQKVDASCPGCPAGIDLTQADYSVRVFAEGILANCEQVAQNIFNVTGYSPGQVSTYEDLWRFTLVNYNAGSGCLYNALARTWALRQPVSWVALSNNLDPVCQIAVGYVEDITRLLKPAPTPTTWLPIGTSQPTPVLPRVLSTPTSTVLPFELSATPTVTPSFAPTMTPTFITFNTVTPTPTGTLTVTPSPTATNTLQP